MSTRRTHLSLSTVLREVGLAGGLFVTYKLGRVLVRGHEDAAVANAGVVRRVESVTWLPSEAAIQGAVHSETLLRTANVYYTYVHFPLITVFLLWGFLCRPLAEYHWARNLWMLQTGAALVLHMSFPLAPPRMFPQWGFVDTMTRYGPSPYEGTSGVLANQFAAMPSLHVGWAVLIAHVVLRTGPRWLGIVAATHAALTLVIVIITGNHWWIDAAVAVLLLVSADAFLGALGKRPHRRTAPNGSDVMHLGTDHPRRPSTRD